MTTDSPGHESLVQSLTRRGLLGRLGALGGGLFACGLAGPAGAAEQGSAKPPDAGQARSLGYVVVSPDGPRDGGDFGRFTEGTKTAGIQEALDYAKANRRDVYLAGGCMPAAFQPPAMYALEETLRIPWMQDFRFDAGECLISYNKPTGDAVVFDSQMSCRYKFGLIISASDGAVVRFQPRTKGPDNFSVITCSKFEFNALVGAGSVWPGEGVKGKGLGLAMDTSAGSISVNDIWLQEVVACDVGIDFSGMVNSFLRVPFAHLCNTHLRLGEPGRPSPSANRIEAGIDSENIKGSAGALVNGSRNVLSLNVVRADPGKGVVFGPEARDNLILTLRLAGGYTNNAAHPTNRIIPVEPVGFSVSTPPFPRSGEAVANREPFTCEAIILTAGKVSGWALTDAKGASQQVAGGLFPGQRLLLEPGDAVQFTYSAAPAWRWKAFA